MIPADDDLSRKQHPNPVLLEILKNPFVSVGTAKKGKKGKK